MLEHGIDRLPARTKIVGNPPRQRPAIRLRHTAEPEMPQNLRAMPAGGAPGKIIVVHGFGIETKLLRQIQDTVGGYRRMIRHKEAMPGEKSKLNRQSQPCRLRFAGHERDVRKTQAPGADQIPTRNAKAHNAAPLSERNVVPRMGDRQQQPARARRALQDDQKERKSTRLNSLMSNSYTVFCLKKK